MAGPPPRPAGCAGRSGTGRCRSWNDTNRSRFMTVIMGVPADGSGPDDAALSTGGPAVPAKEPAARAEQLFASLIRASAPPLPVPRPSSAPAAGEPVRPRGGSASRPEPTDGPEAGVPAQPEPHELLRAALAATDRIAELVDLVAAQADATTADVVAMGKAVEAAFRATNDRLSALERAVAAETGPTR